jgi:2-polyprenyl-3-methyl-5-hydroxy-6-metoxy-1,4-benzoquinol methylase
VGWCMKKFDWSQVKRFYEARSSYWERGGYDDPDALGNVVMTGEPLWVNEYFARSQQMAYQALFDLTPSPRPGAKALDIGCGAGRWARFLSEHGYQTVGIDLQPALIEAARGRYPNIDFLCTSVQEYSSEEPFDLVSSVEVIRHNPFEEQLVVIRNIRESLVDGGFVIMLEGIGADPRPNAFYRAMNDWIEVFEESGFRNIAVQRYYYNVVWQAVRQLASMRRRLPSILIPQGSSRGELSPEKTELTPEESAAIVEPERGYLSSFIRRLVLELNAPVESFLVRRNAALSVRDCGFLFQAV